MDYSSGGNKCFDENKTISDLNATPSNQDNDYSDLDVPLCMSQNIYDT